MVEDNHKNKHEANSTFVMNYWNGVAWESWINLGCDIPIAVGKSYQLRDNKKT